MKDHQTTLLAATISSAGPIIAVMIGIFINSRQIDSLRCEMQSQIDGLRRDMDFRFNSLEKIFTEKLLRVEQIMDACLKRLEEREH